jgi:hypothetical protein
MSEKDKQDQTNAETQAGSKEGDQANTENDNVEPKFSQADLDRAVTAASQKIAEKAEAQRQQDKADLEREKLEAEGKHKELYDLAQAELEAERKKNAANAFKVSANKVLNDMGLGEHAEVLMAGQSDLTQLTEKAQAFKETVDRAVSNGVQERLDTGKSKIPKNTNTETPTLSNMTAEQWTAYKANR